MKYNLITILGPTAVGKTRLAAMLAYEINGEIISADSRQVYRGMDIGTGKDLSDYLVNDVQVPHHIIDIISPHNEFNLYDFQNAFYDSFEKIVAKNKLPFLVGGTGLYLHSILKNYNLSKVEFNRERISELDELPIELLREKLNGLSPQLHNTTDLLIKDRVIKAIMVAEQNGAQPIDTKPQINSIVIGVRKEREEIIRSITIRLRKRLDEGMIDEVKKLLANGISIERLKLFGLEYKFIVQYLSNEINYNDMFQKLNSAIHAFAKRQMTWFRKMEKEGVKIFWLDGADFKQAREIVYKEYFNKTE
ncbi:MAG: tRNA (adenosine(37)-N6)-dimethylallyltransferase MiaA [bacterium]